MTENLAREPLVAVVTPVYNGGKYLRRAMQSVQDQTYRKIVHIVLDNASTDETPHIIDQFEGKDIRVVRYRNSETIPLQSNWNKAFSYLPSEAAYTNLLCSDDLLHAEAIEKFVAMAESDPAIEAVISDAVFADELRRPNLPPEPAAHDGRDIARLIMGGDVGWIAFHHFFVRLAPELLGEAFCGFDWSQDPFVTTRSALRGKVGYVPEPLVYSRFHAESVTGKAVRAKAVQPHMVPLSLIRHFGDAAFNPQERDRALHRYKQAMARQQIVYRLKRSGEGAAALGRALAEQDCRPSAWQYIRSFLSLPSTQWSRRRVHGRPRIMDEPGFLNRRSAIAP